MTQHKSGANFSWSLRVKPKWFRSTLKPVTANSVGVAPRAQKMQCRNPYGPCKNMIQILETHDLITRLKFATGPWLDTVSVFSTVRREHTGNFTLRYTVL